MRDAYRRRPEDFKRRILETIATNPNDLYDREYLWLSLIKPQELGKRYYNHRNVKYQASNLVGKSGKIPSPETLAKRSASLKATYSTPEKKAEQSARAKEYWTRDGVKELHQKTMSDIWATDEHREKVIPKLVSALNTEEYKAQVSAATKERWLDPQYRQNYIDKKTGIKLRPRTEEENEANRQRQLAAWASDEYKQKMSNAHTSETALASSRKNIKATHTPEARERNKEVQRLKRLDPEYNSKYLESMKERARLGAAKRWANKETDK